MHHQIFYGMGLVLAEIWDKQAKGLPILPLENTGKWEVIYADEWRFKAPNGYERSKDKKSCGLKKWIQHSLLLYQPGWFSKRRLVLFFLLEQLTVRILSVSLYSPILQPTVKVFQWYQVWTSPTEMSKIRSDLFRFTPPLFRFREVIQIMLNGL